MFKIYYAGQNALGDRNNAASCWCRRPIWWDYEGTNFVERGSNMLQSATFQIDPNHLYSLLDVDNLRASSFREVELEGIYEVESIQLVPVVFKVSEGFNTFLAYEQQDTTGQNRTANAWGHALCAFVSSHRDNIVPYLVLGVFVGGIAHTLALESFMDDVLSKAGANGFINRDDFDSWVAKNTGTAVTSAKLLLEKRCCPNCEHDEYYTGTYYGCGSYNIKAYPPNYVEVSPGKFKFVGSETPLVRDENGVAVPKSEYKPDSNKEEAAETAPLELIAPSDPRFEQMLADANIR